MPSTLNFDHLLPEEFAAKDFQTVGVAYALATGRTFIADEMGLGKTIQAILVILASGRKRSVVVCPASLKGNWVKEIRRFAPSLRVATLSGRTPSRLPQADVVICNYDILASWADELAAWSPDCLVADESHYIKSDKAQRTIAAIKLAEAIPADGFVLALTGTPLLNRPIEILTQLQFLGRLEDVAPRPRKAAPVKRDWEFSFKYNFCRNEKSKAETGHYTWDDAVNTDLLNESLRRSCYVRRLRAEVLGMNETQRFDVELSLNGALSEYRQAEASFLSWVFENGGPEAVRKAQRAEVLTRMNALRKLAGIAKIEAAIEWTDNFLTSNPEKSLVIFAGHIEVQKALVKHYGCPSILGGQKNVEAQKEAFQAKAHRVIVCSLQAAREGHTLTAAGDVLFVENPWHAGAKNQAEDRINRIGQEAEYVFSWTLLAEGTIDEDIAAMVERKRAIAKAVLDGEEAWDDESAADEVLGGLIGRAA